MNDLEDRLPALLRDAADRVVVRPDMRAVAEETTVLPRLIERPHYRGVTSVRVLALTSVAALAAGLAVIVPAVRDRAAAPGSDTPAIVPVYRNHIDVYPLLRNVPNWAGELTATLVPATEPTGRRVWALVAHRGADSLQSPIIVSTGDPTTLNVADGTPINDVDGHAAYLFEGAGAGRTVLVTGDDDTAELMLYGMADRDVLLEVLAGISVGTSDGLTTFAIDGLPAGYDVVVEPTVQPAAVDSFGITTSAETASLGSLSINIVTDLSDLRFYSARDGAPSLRSIFIGGTGEQLTGWYAMPTSDTIVLAWKLDPGIGIVLTATRSGITAREAIQIAKDVVLTDETTWTETYDAAAIIAAAEASD